MTSIKYIAGYIDAAGSFMIVLKHEESRKTPDHSGRLVIGSRNKELLLEIKHKYGGGVARYRKVKNFDVWRYAIDSLKLKKLLLDALPYMQEKKSQTEIMLIFVVNKRYMDLDERQEYRNYFHLIHTIR